MVPDVLIVIAQHLDIVSLLRLCIMDKKTYRFLHFSLYQDVKLDSSNSIKSFCSTITSNNGVAGKLVKALSIGHLFNFFGTEHCFVFKTLVPEIRAALRVMPNLKDLTLVLTSKALTMTLHTLNPPFQLRRLVYSGNLSMSAIHFLMGQPLITELEFRGHSSCGTSQNLRRALFQKPAYLPHLKTLSGPLSIVPLLSPSRPVSSIVLVDKANVNPEQLFEDIATTSVPLASIRLVSEDPFRGFWWLALKRLKSPSLLSSLREIQIDESVCLSGFNWSERDVSS
ncbi:hypothetical protein BDV93DRAFT_549351 [Ceratobasidium sp. AG-I]|nr:hypothetical protein BDV93DRAFT_549351 [Ceratobasidium sp. AG-I]